MLLKEESSELSQDVNVIEERTKKERALHDKKKELRNEFLEIFHNEKVQHYKLRTAWQRLAMISQPRRNH